MWKMPPGPGWLARVFLACIGVACCAAPLRASAADDVIRLMVGGIEKQIYLPAALADRLGYFKEQGLDVRIQTETSGGSAEDDLLTGSVQGVVGFYDHTIDLQAKGKYVQEVVQFSAVPGEAVVVASRAANAIRSPADFRGHVVGVTGLGSSTHLLMQFLAARQGLRAGDLRVSAVGSGAAFAGALNEGRIDAGMTTEPTASSLLRSGRASLLVDLRTPAAASSALGGTYPGACLYMTTPWINAHRPEVQKLVNALVKALRYIDSHGAAEIAAILPTEFMQGDRALYVDTLAHSKSMFIADGLMPDHGPADVLAVLRLVNHGVQGKPIDLARTSTNQFALASHPGR